MNYYEHHIGDYDEATSHLTACEDGIYSRMIRKYYATEKPLPADINQVQRLVRARTREEKKAVETIIEEFFRLADDGWHCQRCDEEIERYQEKEPERQMKKEGNRERQKRNRERRRKLFEELRRHGIIPHYDTSTAELEATLSRVTSRADNAIVTPPVTRDGTATQSPYTRHQTPEKDITHVSTLTTTNPRERDDESEHPPNPNSAGAMAGALRKLLVDITSQNPILLKWIEDGYTTAQMVEAVEIAKEHKPGERIPAKYLDAVVRTQASQKPSSAGGPNGNSRQQSSKPSLAERATNARKEFERSLAEREADGESVGADDAHLPAQVVERHG